MGGGTPKTVQRPQKSWVLDPNMGVVGPQNGGRDPKGGVGPQEERMGPRNEGRWQWRRQLS